MTAVAPRNVDVGVLIMSHLKLPFLGEMAVRCFAGHGLWDCYTQYNQVPCDAGIVVSNQVG